MSQAPAAAGASASQAGESVSVELVAAACVVGGPASLLERELASHNVSGELGRMVEDEADDTH